MNSQSVCGFNGTRRIKGLLSYILAVCAIITLTMGDCISIQARGFGSPLQSVTNQSGAQQVNKDATSLEIGKPIERELQPNEAHTYQVNLSLNQYLRVVVDQRGIDVVVRLFNPDGKKIAEVDSPNGEHGPEPVSVVGDQTGSYRLEVRSRETHVQPGRYEIKIEEIRPAIQQDNMRIAAEREYLQAEQVGREHLIF